MDKLTEENQVLTTSSDVKIFLMDMKRLYQYAVQVSKTPSRFQGRIAIHFLHYVVEQVLREKAQDYIFNGRLSEVGFEKIIQKLNQKMNIPDYERLLSLNTMRNNAQHQNMVTTKEDVDFQVKIVESFLRWSYKNYFRCIYDDLNFESFISDESIRKDMLEASKLIDAKDFKLASGKMNCALAKFKTKLFAFFADYRLRNYSIEGIPLTEILADLTLKIFLSNDLYTLNKLSHTRNLYIDQNSQISPAYTVMFTDFETAEEARNEYDAILTIILTYQDRFAVDLASLPFA